MFDQKKIIISADYRREKQLCFSVEKHNYIQIMNIEIMYFLSTMMIHGDKKCTVMIIINSDVTTLLYVN